MSVESTRKVMEGYWQAHGSGYLADDAVYTDMGSGQESRGQEAVSGMMNWLFNVAFQARAERATVMVGDGKAAWEGYFVGKHTGEFAGIPATGREVRAPYCVIYDVEDDRIKRARIYMTAAVIQQLTEDQK